MEFIRPATKQLCLGRFPIKYAPRCLSINLQCLSGRSRRNGGNRRALSSGIRQHEEQRQGGISHTKLPQPKSKRPRAPKTLRYLLSGSIGLVACTFIYTQVISSSQPGIFDPPRFAAFTITRREIVSSTSILLVIRPSIYSSLIAHDPYGESWRRGPWSVEIKQPQLQIARSYTPLPPHEEDEPGDLRFLIRRERKGEMSGYLWGLKEGDTMWLRGPKQEYELGEDISDVVFVAGGTGIAPALQIAHTLLERRDGKQTPNIRIFWANRRKEDCLGVGELGALSEDNKAVGPIVQLIQRIQQKHSDKMRVTYLVDELGTCLDQKKMSAALRENAVVRSQPIITRIDSKMLFVSGPEGFVEFVAGGKRFEGGKEVQAPLGGLIGRMGVRDWKVWKM
jgi:cytochrome-b5 reductase